MKGISINLLPQEATISQRKAGRTRRANVLSIVFLMLMFFLASVLVTLRILQNQTISKLQVEAQTSEGQISELRDKESTLVLLKNRLDLISQYRSIPSKQKNVYDAVSSKLPPSITVSAISLDTGGNLSISTISQDSQALQSLLADLTSEESFSKIGSISVESLSRGRDGTYRISLKLTSK